MKSSDILSDYEPGGTGGNRATNGGVMPVKDILYSPPKGPSNINDSKSPGIHGTNHGPCGTQGRR